MNYLLSFNFEYLLMTQKICIATGTRAEWGLLSAIARQLKQLPDVELQIVVTNMHLDPRYGSTVYEIRDQGFDIDAEVPILSDSPSCSPDKDNALAMARCLAGMTEAFSSLQPDMVVILGDRFEMLAVASAAMMLGIPITHIHGGEITLGAIDDSIRHAITKMASLHLTSTETYRHRVIQMGEDPARVINTGAIGVHNALSVPVLSADELAASIGIKPDKNTILLTYHPATLDPVDPAIRFQAVIDALQRFPQLKVIVTYPNNDARSAQIIELIEQFAAANPGRVIAIPSLGMKRYLSALRHIAAVVGNSSSGIIEVPSAGIPTVNIGCRQQGRAHAESVIDCGDSSDEIYDAIRLALSTEMQTKAAECDNPYYQPDTPSRIIRAITECRIPRFSHKNFFDITF